ncbi:ATP-binding cassette domain-containing protein, partial [Candidatus Gracilibacteria bacterium]|nr:ATP-binding cassette domain-containing protein [Candidatus Gracilibacteria bacterium]
NLNQINRLWEKYSKLQRFVEEPNTIINGKNNFLYKKGEIELKNIDFGYSKKVQIFKGLNITFLAGKKNALVGHSGGGKSTITKLLLRLYDINAGKILLDGQEIKTLDIHTFYENIGYLPQEPAIFDGTIRENMEYAFPKKVKNQDDLIWEALKKARIDEMIKKLDKGLNTEVGEKGIKLSGGEKQRLAIARIFLKDPEIIILDEPTSALDSISESKIGKALDELVQGRTSIIIAHRLQTVMYSDKIIVIEDGKIEAEGKHSELIKKSEIYKSLVDLQNGTLSE